jgi:hypothetical protein
MINYRTKSNCAFILAICAVTVSCRQDPTNSPDTEVASSSKQTTTSNQAIPYFVTGLENGCKEIKKVLSKTQRYEIKLPLSADEENQSYTASFYVAYCHESGKIVSKSIDELSSIPVNPLLTSKFIIYQKSSDAKDKAVFRIEREIKVPSVAKTETIEIDLSQKGGVFGNTKIQR